MRQQYLHVSAPAMALMSASGRPLEVALLARQLLTTNCRGSSPIVCQACKHWKAPARVSALAGADARPLKALMGALSARLPLSAGSSSGSTQLALRPCGYVGVSASVRAGLWPLQVRWQRLCAAAGLWHAMATSQRAAGRKTTPNVAMQTGSLALQQLRPPVRRMPAPCQAQTWDLAAGDERTWAWEEARSA